MTTDLDNDTLEWAAEWLDGSLKGEENERVREFARNMAMTFRAAKSDPHAPVAAPVNEDAEANAEVEICPSMQG